MSNTRKKVFIFTLSGMTLMTMSACRWQYNRYQYSVKKWKTLDEQFLKEYPDEISLDNLPWQEQMKKENKINIEDFEYRLIQLKGLLKGQRYFIHRHQDGRPGYLILAPLLNSSTLTNALAVNLGWIPSDLKEEFDKKQYPDEIVEMSALIKRPEKVDYINQQQNKQIQITDKQQNSNENKQNNNENKQIVQSDNILEQSRFNSFIDLEYLKREFNCNIDTNAYLERFISKKEYELKNISETDSQDLYPVVSSPQTFSKPYLTPDKHLSYCTFWGCCTTFGIITVLRVLRM